MSNWVYKGYSRIFVRDEADIERVVNILKELDIAEWETYAPENIVTVWNGKPELVYNHKFELDTDKFYRACMEAGVAAWAVSSYQEYPPRLTELDKGTD